MHFRPFVPSLVPSVVTSPSITISNNSYLIVKTGKTTYYRVIPVHLISNFRFKMGYYK